MTKKKVVVRKKSSQHHGDTPSDNRTQVKYTKQMADMDFLDDLDFGDEFSEEKQTKQAYQTPEQQKLQRMQDKLDKATDRQAKQQHAANVCVSFIMKYAVGLVTVGVTSAICIMMLTYLPKIIENSPSFKGAAGGVVFIIILIWILVVVFEFISFYRKEKENEKRQKL